MARLRDWDGDWEALEAAAPKWGNLGSERVMWRDAPATWTGLGGFVALALVVLGIVMLVISYGI
jgi:hypothetical protein